MSTHATALAGRMEQYRRRVVEELRAVVGGDPAELFASQRIVPQALAGSGFEFSHPQIDGALEAVLAA